MSTAPVAPAPTEKKEPSRARPEGVVYTRAPTLKSAAAKAQEQRVKQHQRQYRVGCYFEYILLLIVLVLAWDLAILPHALRGTTKRYDPMVGVTPTSSRATSSFEPGDNPEIEYRARVKGFG
eukprot:993809-Prymnesium_polylepis.1